MQATEDELIDHYNQWLMRTTTGDSSFVEEPTMKYTLPFSINYTQMPTSTPLKIEQVGTWTVSASIEMRWTSFYRKEQKNKIKSVLNRNFYLNGDDENLEASWDKQQLDDLMKARMCKNKKKIFSTNKRVVSHIIC